MASKHISPPVLVKDKYSTWKKEMQIWEMATSLDKTKRAPIVFLSLEGKPREAVLELDVAALNSEDGMAKLYEKLDTLFFGRYKPVGLSGLRDFRRIPETA